MFTTTKTVLALGVLWLVLTKGYSQPATSFDAGQVFRFKFELNKPLVYDYETKSKSVTDFSSGTRNSMTSKSFDTHYRIRLTATNTNQDGTITVFYEPSDFTSEFETISGSSQLTTSIHGLDILCKQNGIVIVDTKNGVGMGEAQNMKFPIYPFMLSGYLCFDSAGKIQSVSGDLPFVDVWQKRLKSTIGLFEISFPTNSLAVKDSWTNSIYVKESGGMTYDGAGVVVPNVFIRQTDSPGNNSSTSSFGLFESDNYQHLGGYMDQSGQQTTLDFPERNESMNGVFHFDQKLGRLIDMSKNSSMQDSVNWMSQGNPATAHDDTEIQTSFRLISP